MKNRIIKIHSRYHNIAAKHFFKLGYWFYAFTADNYKDSIQLFKILDSDLRSEGYKNYIKNYNLK